MADAPRIDVEIAEGDDGWLANVRIESDGVTTEHRVGIPLQTYEALSSGATPEELVRASFVFLLEREPQSAILSRFDLDVISQYFPEYPDEVGRYFGR